MPDLASQWKALTPEQRDEAMGRMTSAQKKQLATSLGYKGEQSAPSPAPSNQQPSRANTFLSDLGRHHTPEDIRHDPDAEAWGVGGPVASQVLSTVGNVGGRALADVGNMVAHPLNSLEGMYQIGRELVTSPLMPTRNGKNLLGEPMHGPIEDQIRDFQETYKRSPREAIENLSGDLLGMYLSGKLLDAAGKPVMEKVVGPITRGLKEKLVNARENFGSTPRTVRDLVKEVKKENAVTEENNAELPVKQKKYEQDLAVIEAANKAKIDAYNAEADATTEANTKAAQEHGQAVQLVDAENTAKTVKHENNVRSVKEENERAQAEYEADKAEAAKIEKAAKDQQSRRGQLARSIQQQSARMVERLKSIQEKWKDSTTTQKSKGYQPTGILDRAFDQIRKATAGAEGSSSALSAAVKKARSKIVGSTENLKIFKDILSKNPDDDPEFVTLHMSGGKTQIPKGHPLYDVIKEGETEGATPPTWKDLQGYYTEIGRSISSGNLPGDVYQALRSLQDDIGNQMQEMANSRGVGAKWKLTRAQYRDYMQTFRESAGPNHSGSPIAQVLDAKDPAYAIKPLTVEETAQRVRNALSRFDPAANGQGGAASIFDNLRADRREFDNTETIKPPQAPSAPTVKPVPEAPALGSRPVAQPDKPAPDYPSLAEKPTPVEEPKPLRTVNTKDIEELKQKRLEQAANHVRHWGVYLGFVWPAIEVIRGVARGEMPDVGSTAASMIATPLAANAVAGIIESPKMMRLLARATPKDIAQVPEDLRGDLPQIVKAAQSRGIKVSPAMAALVAAGATFGPKTQAIRSARDHARFGMVATNSAGHRIGSNDGGKTWVDIETGEPFHAR